MADNETQFDNHTFRDFTAEYGIKIHYASVIFPRCDYHTKITNKTLLAGVKRRLENAKGKWVDESSVL